MLKKLQILFFFSIKVVKFKLYPSPRSGTIFVDEESMTNRRQTEEESAADRRGNPRRRSTVDIESSSSWPSRGLEAFWRWKIGDQGRRNNVIASLGSERTPEDTEIARMIPKSFRICRGNAEHLPFLTCSEKRLKI